MYSILSHWSVRNDTSLETAAYTYFPICTFLRCNLVADRDGQALVNLKGRVHVLNRPSLSDPIRAISNTTFVAMTVNLTDQMHKSMEIPPMAYIHVM